MVVIFRFSFHVISYYTCTCTLYVTVNGICWIIQIHVHNLYNEVFVTMMISWISSQEWVR